MTDDISDLNHPRHDWGKQLLKAMHGCMDHFLDEKDPMAHAVISRTFVCVISNFAYCTLRKDEIKPYLDELCKDIIVSLDFLHHTKEIGLLNADGPSFDEEDFRILQKEAKLFMNRRKSND